MYFEDGFGEVLLIDVFSVDLDPLEEGEYMRRCVYSGLVSCLFEYVGSFERDWALAIGAGDVDGLEGILRVV